MSPFFNLKTPGSFNFWRRMTNFWTLIFFAAIVYDFFNNNFLSQSDILLAIAAIYAAFLALYSAEKEFRRWHHMHGSSLHPGEFYIIIWTILIIVLILGAIFYNPSYRMPTEVSASYIGAIGILALTRESKNFYKRKHKK